MGGSARRSDGELETERVEYLAGPLERGTMSLINPANGALFTDRPARNLGR